LESKERAQLIENYSRKTYLLTKHLGQFPREMWEFKPDGAHWCIREILWHILDIEMHAYLRFRTAVAEPGKTVSAPEQEAWAMRLDYARLDIDDAIEGLVWVIKANGKLLSSRPGEDFTQAVVHPEYGTLNLDLLLERHNRHIQHHMDQMTKRFQEWKSLK
jgi:hypothetical protein